jgi:chromosome segregation ATPase
MEIRIRTAEEFRAAHMTIEIKAADQDEAVTERLYTDNEVANLQASEAALVSAPLQKRINELEDKLVKAEVTIRGYDEDRHTERDRADQVTREHSMCAGKLELREKDADTFRAQRNKLEGRVKELESELANAQTQRDSLVAERERSADNHNALADRVRELERSLASSRELVAFKDDVIANIHKDLEEGRQADHREIVELRRQRDEAELKFSVAHVCVGLCTENNHVSSLGRETLMKAENKVAELTRRIDNARVLLSSPEVKQAQGVDCTRTGTTMSAAIIKALETLA